MIKITFLLICTSLRGFVGRYGFSFDNGSVVCKVRFRLYIN